MDANQGNDIMIGILGVAYVRFWMWRAWVSVCCCVAFQRTEWKNKQMFCRHMSYICLEPWDKPFGLLSFGIICTHWYFRTCMTANASPVGKKLT